MHFSILDSEESKNIAVVHKTNQGLKTWPCHAGIRKTWNRTCTWKPYWTKWQHTFQAFDILTFTMKCVTRMRLLWKRLVETQARAPRAIWSSTSCSSFASFFAPTWFFSSWYLAKWLRTWSPSSSCICAELLWQMSSGCITLWLS